MASSRTASTLAAAARTTRSTRARLLTLTVTLALTTACTGPGAPATRPPASLSTSSATSPATTPTATLRTRQGAGAPAAPTSPEVVAQNLDVPWGLAFLPDGAALVTTRDDAHVLRVARGADPVDLGAVPGVTPGGEGGLLGVAVSPTFASDRLVYVYLTAAQDNRVIRMKLDGNRLTPDRDVLTGIPKAGNHNGGRIAFGPDKQLYIATGDAGRPDTAQDPSALGGKILRVTADGQPPPGNPTAGSPVWSLGHRNPQGLAWDEAGRMWAAEFGQNTYDELNHIEKGKNYGWPEVEGYDDSAERRFTNPVAQWRTDEASPSGVAIGPDGSAYLAALKGERLWRVPLSNGQRSGDPQSLLQGDYGRLRTVQFAPDSSMWILTSNTFRGERREGDDQVIALPVPS